MRIPVSTSVLRRGRAKESISVERRNISLLKENRQLYPNGNLRELYPELIRCEDCIFRTHANMCLIHSAIELGGKGVFIMPSDFCSYGERKADE